MMRRVLHFLVAFTTVWSLCVFPALRVSSNAVDKVPKPGLRRVLYPSTTPLSKYTAQREAGLFSVPREEIQIPLSMTTNASCSVIQLT
jgi:hypothetical protein